MRPVGSDRPETEVLQLQMSSLYPGAQGAVWAVRWPCSILAIAVKTLSYGKTIFFRLFFLWCLKEENSKTCFAFHFPALETLFLEHSNDPEIPN